ncbi:hypothetical protein B5S32_g31 [[Candida] boidinii]|nr:hypothetical protein B5S32_g31 [[Candida] boidinii]
MTQNAYQNDDTNTNKNNKSNIDNTTTTDPNIENNVNDSINNSCEDEFIIPKNSFTSFRLKYSNPRQIYMNSLSVSIGPIPHIWILDKKQNSLRNLLFKLKNSNDFKSSKISSRDIRYKFSKHLNKDNNPLPQINFDHINIEKDNIITRKKSTSKNSTQNLNDTISKINELNNDKILKEKLKPQSNNTKSNTEFSNKLDEKFNNHKNYNDNFLDRSQRFTKELNSKLQENKEKQLNSDDNDLISNHNSINGPLILQPRNLDVNQLEIVNSNINDTQSIKSSETKDSFTTNLSRVSSDSSNFSKSDKIKNYLSTKLSIKSKFNKHKHKKSHIKKDDKEISPIPLPTSKTITPTTDSSFEKKKNNETISDENKPQFNTSKSLDANHYTDIKRQPRSILKHVFSEPVMSNGKTQVRIQDYNTKNEALDNFTTFLNNLSRNDDFDDDFNDDNNTGNNEFGNQNQSALEEIFNLRRRSTITSPILKRDLTELSTLNPYLAVTATEGISDSNSNVALSESDTFYDAEESLSESEEIVEAKDKPENNIDGKEITIHNTNDHDLTLQPKRKESKLSVSFDTTNSADKRISLSKQPTTTSNSYPRVGSVTFSISDPESVRELDTNSNSISNDISNPNTSNLNSTIIITNSNANGNNKSKEEKIDNTKFNENTSKNSSKPKIPIHERIKRGKGVRLQKLEPVPDLSDDCEDICRDNFFGHNLDYMKNISNTYRKLKYKYLNAGVDLNEEILQYRQKVKIGRLFSSFAAGDIIQMEKMLVMVTQEDYFSAKNKGIYNRRILDRWKEYIVVVRSTGDIYNPLVIQFFKRRKILKRSVRNTIDFVVDNTSKGVSDGLNIFINSKQKDSKVEATIEDDDNDDDDDSDGDVYDKYSNSKKNNKYGLGNTTDNSKNKCEFEFVLNSKTSIEFHSILDKSIIISQPKKGDPDTQLNYILLCQVPSSAVRWLSFLKSVLSQYRDVKKKTLLLSIPDLKLSLSIKNAASLSGNNEDNSKNPVDDSVLRIKYTPHGYILPRSGTFDNLVNLVAVKMKTVDVKKRKHGNSYLEKHFNKADAEYFLNKLSEDKNSIAFAVKNFDRLEWITGTKEKLLQSVWFLLSDTHDIELRAIVHNPDHLVRDPSLKQPEEIEGFLTRLTNASGKLTSHMGRHYYKVCYFHSVDNLLFFSPFYKAVPPFVESTTDILSSSGFVYDRKKLLDMVPKRPLLFKNSRFPLDESGTHIEWLKPGLTTGEFNYYENEALNEAERKTSMVLKAKGVINLNDIVDVRPISMSSISHLVKLASIITWNLPSSEINNPEYMDSSFEIEMKNGSVMRLQAGFRRIRDEWVTRLKDSVMYWQDKKREELLRLVNLQEKNANSVHMLKSDMEASVTAAKSRIKWESGRTATDPTLFNISSFALVKSVIMSGELYQKTRKHKQFKKFFFVLAPGYLLIFKLYQRDKATGVAGPTTYYEFYSSIELSGCYIYCDRSTDMDSFESSAENINQGIPGETSIPRVYGDGWRSSESSFFRYFTLWFGSKKMIIRRTRKNTQSNSSDNPNPANKIFKKSRAPRDKSSSKSKTKVSSNHNENMDDDVSSIGDSSDEDDSGDDSEEESDDESEEGSAEETEDEETEEEDDDEEEGDDRMDFDNVSRSHHSLKKLRKRQELKVIKNVSRLGVTGKSMFFIARSRQERDLWVTKLLNEIERFSEISEETVNLV